jgi:hypothetical protein
LPAHNKILNDCRIGGRAIYYIGTFNAGVTVLSQQTRALNLALAMVESSLIRCAIPDRRPPKSLKIAVVGGGFAGLTFAAGLIAKHAAAEITIFEERDVLIPLQHGSDSRWLHPQIYGWPGPSSEMTAAMLPIMNWTAARASDVAVQILSDWKAFATRSHARVTLYCNTRHLQIQEEGQSNQLRLEWVGEKRNPKDGSILDEAQKSSLGASEVFNCVVLAVGFGLEADNAFSYWRNEELAQPSLEQPRKTYMVSGAGDGAMIDLLRLRVSSYRQDRILDQLFSGSGALVDKLKSLYRRQRASRPPNLFNEFERLYDDTASSGKELRKACDGLRSRLRRDTEVILHIRQRSFAALFGHGTSFQNRLLVYLLFKCGGFVPMTGPAKNIEVQHSIAPDCVVTRHGTLREDQFRRVLFGKLVQDFNRRVKSRRKLSLTDEPQWPGGYFGQPGSQRQSRLLSDRSKKVWRKEYLPSPTSLLASALCAAIAGLLAKTHPKEYRLRVTLHRSIMIHGKELLQQACDYQGLLVDDDHAAGRTFPAANATIGLAYACRRIVRSKNRVAAGSLRTTMKRLRLNLASSNMRKDVGFVLAIPLLEGGDVYTSPSPVAGVLYIDSNAPNYYIGDDDLTVLGSIAQKFLDGMTARDMKELSGVRNFPLAELTRQKKKASELPPTARRTLEWASLPPPSTRGPYQFNYDFSDFAPTKPTA